MSDINKIFDIRQDASKSYNKSYTATEQLGNFVSIVLKLLFVFVFLSINFLGLSVALNCNAHSTISVKVASAIFGFFFGFIYLLLNYYTYRVLTLKKVCIMNKNRLFPFII